MATKHKRHVRKETKKRRNVAKGRTASLRERFANNRTSSVRKLRSQGFKKTSTL